MSKEQIAYQSDEAAYLEEQKAEKLQGSASYIWFLDNCLGHGSVGNVYLARHRHQGDKYAVKVVKVETKKMSIDYMKRELDILKDIPAHDNIVKIIDIEQQRRTNDNVIIMELCDGGSLYQFLTKPENYFGLEEEDFLSVLFNIGDAIEHLHKNGILHRDIKPGNILLYTLPNNKRVYKLTDFGTAKHVGDEIQNVTGTEEYMHPDMHRDFFIHNKIRGYYDSDLDLWSFGVTIYQCATGMFPFKPRVGIKNDKRTMQRLVREKDPDVISQIEEQDGLISSHKELPDQCYLTSGTKKNTENLLTLLFDLTTNREWIFFKEFHQFQSKTKIYLLDVVKASMYTLYVDPESILADVKKRIAKWTGVPVDEQLLFWDMRHLVDAAVETRPIVGWLKTTTHRLLLMVASCQSFSRKNSRSSQQHIPDMPKNGPDDAKWAKETYGLIYLIEDRIKQNVLSQQHIALTDILLRNAIDDIFKLVTSEQNYLDKTVDLLMLLSQVRDLGNYRNLEPIRKQLQELDVHSPTDEPMAAVCQDCRCGHKSGMITKDAGILYISITKGNRAPSHNDMELSKYNKSELRRHYRRIKKLFCCHCSKETDFMSHGLEKRLRNYVSLVVRQKQVKDINLLIEDIRNNTMESYVK